MQHCQAALTAKPFCRIPRYRQAVEAGCTVISYLETGARRYHKPVGKQQVIEKAGLEKSKQ
jgi:hypothetical protein